ncbi:LuxR family transcriptional regulator [Mesorhizobium sp. WSM4303]|uniref:helix-turn-helix transcriptional regulator n=1 Tax=unclassified Mesorhizobium TaxID=325217 RepID=UPI00115D6896|nr:MULTISPECIES: LuxR C-terminal-related transcriptional regulator [unclassified Mesorhizobium]TRD00105.1 LuxR family transcriptional regulator [Mesorhizobium sp. WSM4303]TRD00331.1 LuxR family transcriptional regulator [Mesorhizobium sp. WSM4306]
MSIQPNINGRALPQIVEAIYDSIADVGRWQSTLESICKLAIGRLAMLAVVDTSSNSARFSMCCGDPALLEPLQRDYASEVPFFKALPKMDIDMPFTVDSIYALQGPDARQNWIESRIVREWVEPNRLDDFFWVALIKQPTRTGTMMVVTDKDRPQISARDLDLISTLAPHVRRAVTIGDLFEAERRKADIFASIVESLDHPVLIVADDMQIIFANPAAEALLAQNTSVTSVRGQLSFAYGNADAAIGRAVELGTRNEFALGPSGINIPLVRSMVPAVAHVMPLARRDISARMSQRAAAAIFIAAAGAAPVPALEAIAALFGLTAAEKRVAGHVATGLTRREIAAASGISDGTIKSQLATIFDKTSTGDQRELQLLMRELTPPLRSA